MGAAGKPRTGTEVLEETRTELAKPWKVIVHDDPINLMGYVTRVFMQVFGYPKPKAEKHMLEVHKNGRSLLWTGGREQAEVYAMKLRAAPWSSLATKSVSGRPATASLWSAPSSSSASIAGLASSTVPSPARSRQMPIGACA